MRVSLKDTWLKHFKLAFKNGYLVHFFAIKMNRERPLAVIDLDHFFEMLSKVH